MEKLNLNFFYQLGAQLNPITNFIPTENNRIDIWLASGRAESFLIALMTNKSFAPLTVCRPAGTQLLNAISGVKKWMNETPPEKWKEKQWAADQTFKMVVDKAKEFETILGAELQTLGTYVVSQKGIYSIAGLVNFTEYMLPDSIRLKMGQDVINEIRQSGMCLAFDVPTASAFHILRATEIILHEYYISVCKPEKNNRLDNWGAYIAALAKSTDPNVKETVAILQQIKNNDRNLIMHPERTLTPDDAFILFEVTKGAIMAMSVKLVNPIEISPKLDAKNVDINPTFTWPTVAGSDIAYELVVAEELGNPDKFAIIDYSATTITNFLISPQSLKYSTKYWWRVRTVNKQVVNNNWTTSFFTTKAQPPTTETTL